MKITAFRKDVPDKLQLPHAIAWFPIVRKKAKLDLRVLKQLDLLYNCAQCSVLSAQCSVLSAQCSKVLQTLHTYEANRLVCLPIQCAFAEHIHHLMLCIMLQFLQRYA